MTQSTYKSLIASITNDDALNNKASEIDNLIRHESWGAAGGCVNQLFFMLDKLNLTLPEKVRIELKGIALYANS